MKYLLIILLCSLCVNVTAQRLIGGASQDTKLNGNIFMPNVDSVATATGGCLIIDAATKKLHRVACGTGGGGSSQWVDTTGAIFYSLGNVGIGARFIPLNTLDVHGTANVTAGLYVVATTTTGLSERFRVYNAATSGSILAAFGDGNNKSLYIGSTGTASNYFGWGMPANVHFIASDYDGGGPFADIGIITGEQARIIFKANGTIGIGNMTPAASSILDITGTTGGLLIPRMTTTQRNAISSPATGLEIFNTTTGQFEFYNGSAWVAVGGGGSGAPFSDATALVSNSSDATKLVKLSAASITTGTTRTWTFPDVSGTFARIDAAQTFTGIQTFSSSPLVPDISDGDSTGKAAPTEWVTRQIANLTNSLDVITTKDITTTNATTVNVDTIPISPGENIHIEIIMNAVKDNGHASVESKKVISFLLDDASSLHSGTSHVIETEEYLGSGLSTANFVVIGSGSLIILQFTGEASTNILARFTETITRKGAPL